MFRPLRLPHSLLSAHLSTAAVTLAIAGVLLLAFEFVRLRQEFEADLQAHARVVALNSAAAIVFGDREAALETLTALETLRDLRFAVIYDVDGNVVAAHRPAQPAEHADTTPAQGPYVDGARLSLTLLSFGEPIVLDGRRVGTLVIESGLGRLYGRVAALAGVFLVVGLGGLLVSYPLMARMSGRVKAAEARLNRLAHYDPVTGLLNRNAFNQYLEELAARPARDSLQLGLLLLDIDNFKTVNDSLGHPQGDELLRQIAGRLSAAVRVTDRVFRVGGDEFAVTLCPIDGADGAEQVTRRLFAQFESRFRLDNHEVDAAVSGGISLFPQDAQTVQALAGNADTAMYLAKRNGRNRFEFFRPEMNAVRQFRSRMNNDLRTALQRQEFRLEYQPQVAAGDLRVVSVEALMRWDHPELGAVAPGDFIPVAEEGGQIVPLGRWALETACRDAAAWRAAGMPGLLVAVNVSVRQMRSGTLLADIERALAKSGLPADALELELTESLLLENADDNIALLKQLRARGIKLAIDDFGTGYSSMAYLQQLPLDRLKIDMSFVRAIPGDGEAITTAIIAMAHRLRIEVVAEGVETTEQYAFLRDAGCDVIQGYWAAKPLRPELVPTACAASRPPAGPDRPLLHLVR